MKDRSERLLLLAELRAGKRDALERLRLAIEAKKGCIRDAAAELNVLPRTLYKLAKRSPEVDRILKNGGMGRRGAAIVGAVARAKSPILLR